MSCTEGVCRINPKPKTAPSPVASQTPSSSTPLPSTTAMTTNPAIAGMRHRQHRMQTIASRNIKASSLMVDRNPEYKISVREFDTDMIAPSSVDSEFGGSKIVIIGKPGCFAADTPILMSDGTVRAVQDVDVGDALMGDDGKSVRRVLELCRGEEKMYRIHLPDGRESLVVNEGHKLVLYDTECGSQSMCIDDAKRAEGVKFDNPVIMTVREFIDKMGTHPQKRYLWRRSTGVDAFFDEEVYKQHLSKNEAYSYGREGIFLDMSIPALFKLHTRETRLKVIAGLVDSSIKTGVVDITEKKLSIAFHKYTRDRYTPLPVDDIRFIIRSIGMHVDIRIDLKKIEMSIHTPTKRLMRELLSWTKHTVIQQRLRQPPPNSLSSPVISPAVTPPTLEMMEQYGNEEKLLEEINRGIEIEDMSNSCLSCEFTIKEESAKGQYYGFTLDGNHLFLGGNFDVLSNTGKSTALKSILYAKRHIIPCAMVMSGTEDTNHFYKKFIPSSFVYNEYNENKIEDFIKRQKLAKNYLPNAWSALIVDDCTDNPAIFRKPTQQKLFKNGRHYQCLYFLSLQYAIDLPVSLRTNIDASFIFREPILKNRKSIYENLASIIPSFQIFCLLMDALTENYSCLVIMNQTISNKWEDSVFYYKADIPPQGWLLGSPELWDFHHKRYDPEYNENPL